MTAAAALMVTTSVARAEFPEKPVEMTVLFGGNAQTIGQLLADLMSKELPQPVVAVSRTGGGGAIGYTHVNSTDPDGYNIVWNSNSISSNYHQGNLPFNYEAFTPIARVSVEVPALAVRADTGWESLSDMVKAVKSGDTKLKVGDSGQGSFTHLTSVAVLEALGINDDTIYVPYGDGKAPVELLAGRIDAAVQWPGQFVQHHEEGTLRILCVTGAERVALLPETPTCAEAGAEGVDITMWRGLAAPAGTPDDVVQAIEAAAKAATETEEFKTAAKNLGFDISFMDADAFGELIARDDAAIEKLLKAGSN
ncbi:MAG TPA: tripartite tricarboxylate transporter substrate binding protein [Aestuariivirgaceae bacterium]|nr:tripartite tricarboxylate transporter substrate binding protein [Aestuariivirgaceae bacterium]